MVKFFKWKSSDLESVEKCPVCRWERSNLYYNKIKDLIFDCGEEEWFLYKCERCGSAFLNPRPTRNSIHYAYQNYFTHYTPDILRKDSPKPNLFRRLINGYAYIKHGLEWGVMQLKGAFLVKIIPPLYASYQSKLRHLAHIRPDGLFLLDVGCGNGDFIQDAEKLGWNAEGVDFDPSAVSAGKEIGLNISLTKDGSFGCSRAEYDCITVSHVIEHVHDPQDLILECFNHLKSGGILWIETPNIDSFGNMIFKKYWRGLEPPRHLTILSRKGLIEILSNVGFDDIEQKYHGMSVPQIFPLSEVIRKERSNANISPGIRILVLSIIFEILEMLVPAKREFLTFRAIKP